MAVPTGVLAEPEPKTRNVHSPLRQAGLILARMRITFLGSGGAFTDFRVNYHNNALSHTAEGPVLLTGIMALLGLGYAAFHTRSLSRIARLEKGTEKA